MTAQTALPAIAHPPRTRPAHPSVRGRAAARPLVVAHLAESVGAGLTTAGVPVLLIRSAGLTVGQIAVAVAVAGSIALALSLPIGVLTDRWGARRVAVLMFGLRALAVVSFLAVDSPAALALVAAAALTAERGTRTGLGVLTSAAGAGPRLRLRRYLRPVATLGVPAGAVLAGVLIAVDSPRASAALILAGAVTAGLAAAVLAGSSGRRTPRLPAGPGRVPMRRDLPYLGVAAVRGLLSLAHDVAVFALPPAVALHIGAPLWVAAGLIVLNAALVASFRVPVARGLALATRAAVAGHRTAFLAAAALIAFAGPGHPRRLTGLLLSAALVLAVAGLVPA